MVYSSTIFRVKEVLGIALFGEDRRFGEVVRKIFVMLIGYHYLANFGPRARSISTI